MTQRNGQPVDDKTEAARELAHKQFELEAGLVHVFRIVEAGRSESASEGPIRLLQVNADTVGSGVMPLHFGAMPTAGINYPSIIIEVTPDEFEKINRAELKLPDGLEIGEELPRAVASRGSRLMATNAQWVSGYARQADADFRTFLLLQGQPVPECHKLQFLQMACEKLSKAYLCGHGTDPASVQKANLPLRGKLIHVPPVGES